MRHAASSASAAEGLEPGHHSGELPAAQRLLVIYHYYEDIRSCPADEEVQLVRANFAYFLRCTCPAVSDWHGLLTCVVTAAISNSAGTRMLLRRAAVKADDGADYLINLGESGMQGAQHTWVVGGLCN